MADLCEAFSVPWLLAKWNRPRLVRILVSFPKTLVGGRAKDVVLCFSVRCKAFDLLAALFVARVYGQYSVF